MFSRRSTLFATLGFACLALTGAFACSAFDEAAVGASTTAGNDGAPGGNDATSDAPSASFDAAAADAALTDASNDDATAVPDGGIAEFSPACAVDDTKESETNDTAMTANLFTASACGTMIAATDVDYLTFTLAGAAPFTVAFACTGDARFTIALPTGSYASGNNSAGGFATKTFPGVAAHTYTIKIDCTDVQDWRLVVQR
jgi:hypothetical protein